MEDFYYAGGLPAVLRELKLGGLLRDGALTVNGRRMGENVSSAQNFNVDVISRFDSPYKPEAGIVILRGNLAPEGAVIKPAAATSELFKHRGRAIVFSSIEDFKARIDSPDLDVDAMSVLVLQGAGPRGYPGMPEVRSCMLSFLLPRCYLTCLLISYCYQNFRNPVHRL